MTSFLCWVLSNTRLSKQTSSLVYLLSVPIHRLSIYTHRLCCWLCMIFRLQPRGRFSSHRVALINFFLLLTSTSPACLRPQYAICSDFHGLAGVLCAAAAAACGVSWWDKHALGATFLSFHPHSTIALPLMPFLQNWMPRLTGWVESKEASKGSSALSHHGQMEFGFCWNMLKCLHSLREAKLWHSLFDMARYSFCIQEVFKRLSNLMCIVDCLTKVIPGLKKLWSWNFEKISVSAKIIWT